MKSVLSFSTAFLLLLCQELPNVREQYVAAYKDADKAEVFYQLMSNYTKDDKVLLAYKGASMTLMAKYAKTIKEKKSFFVEGVKLLEKTVKSDPDNFEIRLIRLSIQENAPRILNYKKNMEEDKKLILSNFGEQSQFLKEYTKKYIKQSAAFTDKEKKSILN